MKKFKTSLKGEFIFGIGFVVLLWIVLILSSSHINDTQEKVKLISYTLIFALTIILGWIKQTYLTIQDNQIKHVSFFLERKTANISDIKVITVSIVGGFIKFLCLIHYRNGKEKFLQISPSLFSKKTLNEFVTELKKINPQIEVHETVKKLIG